MAAWYRRKLQEDAALDVTMGEVVEYDFFQKAKPPSPPQQQPTDTTTQPSNTSPTTPIIPFNPPRAFATNPNLSYTDYQHERTELAQLEQCANQSALRIAAASLTVATGAYVWARQRQGRSRVGGLFTAAFFGLFSASVTWRLWGRECAVVFLEGEGSVAERGRRRLREEMSDHPILIEYEEKQRQKRAIESSSAIGSETGVEATQQQAAKDTR